MEIRASNCTERINEGRIRCPRGGKAKNFRVDRPDSFLASFRAVPVIIFNKRNASASRIVFPCATRARNERISRLTGVAFKCRRSNDVDKSAELPGVPDAFLPDRAGVCR